MGWSPFCRKLATNQRPEFTTLADYEGQDDYYAPEYPQTVFEAEAQEEEQFDFVGFWSFCSFGM